MLNSTWKCTAHTLSSLLTVRIVHSYIVYINMMVNFIDSYYIYIIYIKINEYLWLWDQKKRFIIFVQPWSYCLKQRQNNIMSTLSFRKLKQRDITTGFISPVVISLQTKIKTISFYKLWYHTSFIKLDYFLHNSDLLCLGKSSW